MIPLFVVRKSFDMACQKSGIHCAKRRMEDNIENLSTDRNFRHRGKREQGRAADAERFADICSHEAAAKKVLRTST